MGDIQVAQPPKVRVSWSCKRCKHTGGSAQTTIPIEPTWTEGMWPVMLKTLREKLVRVHQRGQGCVALPEDFIIGRWTP